MNDNATTVQPSKETSAEARRDVIFISKATPGDDEFVLWLAPKLEEAGYTVFADILTLEPGERWRKTITNTLQTRAIKMLLCCRDATLAADGVIEEIEIATDLVKQLGDPKFIIPLRLEPFKKVFGIGGLQYIDFVRGWADGLGKLLDTLKRQKVPSNPDRIVINPNWEMYRRRKAIELRNEPERLTSNWLRVVEIPDTIGYFEPIGAANRSSIASACHLSKYPDEPLHQGILSFRTLDEVNSAYQLVARFELKHELPVMTFRDEGLPSCGLEKQDASNLVHSMFRQAWNTFCRDLGLLECQYSAAVGFHVSKDQAKIGQKIPWGKQGDKRSSMLRNAAKGHVWQFGVSSIPAFWPFPHFKLKSRVLFAPLNPNEAGDPITDAKKQHRLRRTVCKGWRNKQWHGRLMAFIELLCGEASFITLPLGETAFVKLEAAPMLFSSPVSTYLLNQLTDEEEETDETTLGRPEPEDDP